MGKSKNKILVSFLIALCCSSFISAQAEVLNLKDVFTETSYKGDGSFGNTWINDVSGQSDNSHYTGTLDYRLETTTPIYKLKGHTGLIITRVEGLGFIDEEIDDFFHDRLIDIPELFFVNATSVGGSDAALVFGKFAHRRFIDKDEIIDDPFDIGERKYFGDWTGPQSIQSLIGEGREGAGRFTSKQARGNYGFALAIKDRDGDSFWDRWGIKQAFVVTELDGFGDKFWEATEINKNWGDAENPGQFNIGFITGQNRVLPVFDSNFYHFYTSLIQKRGDIAAYTRYSNLNSDFVGTPGDFSLSNIQFGLQYDLTETDRFSADFLHTNSKEVILGLDKSSLLSFNWRHKFNEHFYSNVNTGFGFESSGPQNRIVGNSDDNWFMGFNLVGVL